MSSLPDDDEPGFPAAQVVKSTTSAVLPRPTGRFTGPSPSSCDVLPFGDAVAVLIVCRRHRKLALSQVDANKGLWFPIQPVKFGDSYTKTLSLLLTRLVDTGAHLKQAPELIHMLRLQVPSLDFVSRLLYYVELQTDLTSAEDSCLCTGASTPTVNWFGFSQLYSVGNLWGTEPLAYVNFIVQTGTTGEKVHSNTTETSLDELSTLSTVDSPLTDMMKDCKATEEDLLLLYSEFIQHSYPSQFMNQCSFVNYATRSGIDFSNKSEQDLARYFHAFTKFPEPGQIRWGQFIEGLLALDKQVLHGKRTGRLRCEYIYRFYQVDRPGDGGTEASTQFDMSKFAADLMDIERGSISAKVKWLYEAMNLPLGAPVSLAVFFEAVGSLKIRGTSPMFRAGYPLKHIKSQLLYRPMDIQFASTRPKKPYILATHTVTLNRTGAVVNAESLENVSSGDPNDNSTKMFLPKTPPRVLMELIRKFASNEKQKTKAMAQFKTQHSKITDVCEQAKALLAAESRMLKVASPVFVLGDLHGNLADLLLYERQLWPLGPSCLATSYLFLGDYVDRGTESVELVTYLLCCKILAPNRFLLLRGNHETRSVQMDFQFFKECKDKFGKKTGQELWECFNQVFDAMPICAVIDGQIFCAHGGIPMSVNKIEQIPSKIPCPMADPETQSPVAWEILWNDVISNENYAEQLNMAQENNAQVNLPSGFVRNASRGTAYYFSEDAAANFLALNGLSFILRAHELVQAGFEFHADNKVITVFSSSNYEGTSNSAACLLVDGVKVRVIRIRVVDPNKAKKHVKRTI